MNKHQEVLHSVCLNIGSQSPSATTVNDMRLDAADAADAVTLSRTYTYTKLVFSLFVRILLKTCNHYVQLLRFLLLCTVIIFSFSHRSSSNSSSPSFCMPILLGMQFGFCRSIHTGGRIVANYYSFPILCTRIPSRAHIHIPINMTTTTTKKNPSTHTKADKSSVLSDIKRVYRRNLWDS